MTVETRPKTTEPASRSRENSLQHGFTGAGVILPPDMAREVEERRAQYTATYQPRNLHEHDLIHQASLGIVRFNRLQPMFSDRARLRSEQAQTHWPMLRSVDAQERFKRLTYDPPLVLAQLRTTIGGVEWLLKEWKLLRLALEDDRDWTPKQVELAQNLVGVPRVHRHLDPEKVRGGSTDQRRALADRQIGDLERLLGDDELARQDEIQRQGIIQQLDGFQDPLYDRLLRYEQRALRLHRAALIELENRHAARRNGPPTDSPSPSPSPASSSASSSSPIPEADAPAEAVEPPTRPVDPVRSGPPRVKAPLMSMLSNEEYLESVMDPEKIDRIPISRVPGPDHPYRKQMAAWIEANQINLDVVSAVRGLFGCLVSLGTVVSAEPTHQDELAILIRGSRHEENERRSADRESKKQRRRAQALARKRNR